MKYSDSDIDDKIRQALSEHDEQLDFDLAGEQGFFELFFGVFRGRMAWVNLLGAVFQLACTVLTFWALWRFLGASEVREQIHFATIFLGALGSTGMVKIWFWMVVNRNSVVREIKRLELQVARLSHG